MGIKINSEEEIKTVNNVPDYAKASKNKYWIVRNVDGELWFLGAYKTFEQVQECKEELNNTDYIIITKQVINQPM